MKIGQTILDAYKLRIDRLLKNRLEAAEAAVYDNATSTVLAGNMVGEYMATYNATGRLVTLEEDKTERGSDKPCFNTPPDDPVVVVMKSTRIMLDDRILEKAKTLTEISAGGEPFDKWTVSEITWINGVPGCGKTTAMLRAFKKDEDMVITATKKSAEEIREKLQPILGDDAKARVRTMASFIVH
ncbi:hypothetical protein K1T71_006185 [Dendrolimus kikuchii]|uniref:Uncharacterized protein n=1 Tax=Dendrolimus kikuchii TaxID=765133 RepID=A0ACC1D4C4_9NEOP|nr:hypothetical protein K1T71_006185 [Dendrolimus kikuchii]